MWHIFTTKCKQKKFLFLCNKCAYFLHARKWFLGKRLQRTTIMIYWNMHEVYCVSFNIFGLTLISLYSMTNRHIRYVGRLSSKDRRTQIKSITVQMIQSTNNLTGPISQPYQIFEFRCKTKLHTWKIRNSVILSGCHLNKAFGNLSTIYCSKSLDFLIMHLFGGSSFVLKSSEKKLASTWTFQTHTNSQIRPLDTYCLLYSDCRCCLRVNFC